VKEKNWPRLSFREAFADKTAAGHKLQQSSFKVSGKIPIVDQGQSDIAGFSDQESLSWKHPLPVLVFGDHTRAIKYVDFPFILGADGVKVLVPREGLSARFAYYYLKSIDIPSGGYSRHFRFLKEVNVPLPPASEQERVIKLLDKADELRKLRANADPRTAALIPALFHQMFGDPATNPSAWPVRRLDAVVAPGRIVTYGIVQAGPNLPNGVPYIRTGDLKDGVIQLDRLLRTSPEIASSYRRSEVMPGDIVMSIRATVGTTATVPQELSSANLTQGTARISPGPETLTDLSALVSPNAGNAVLDSRSS